VPAGFIAERSVTAENRTPRAKSSTSKFFSKQTIRMRQSYPQQLKFLVFDSPEGLVSRIWIFELAVGQATQDIAVVSINWSKILDDFNIEITAW
jgi:hypothetical protein